MLNNDLKAARPLSRRRLADQFLETVAVRRALKAYFVRSIKIRIKIKAVSGYERLILRFTHRSR